MKRIVMIVTLTLLLAVPVLAQDAPAAAQQDLPPGCNLSVLSEVFTSVGTALADMELPVSQAMGLMSAFEGLMQDTKIACGEVEVPPVEGAIDFSQIEQSRLEDGGFVLGSPDAPITIVEFADFLCPHCHEYDVVIAQFIKDYVITGQARLEYRMYPVIDPQASVLAAVMVECSDTLKSGSFWDAREMMFELISLQGYNTLTPFRFAARAGLDFDSLATCAGEAGQIMVDAEVGQSVGVSGTPAIRMRLGDSDMVPVEYEGTVYDRGGVSLDILAAVVEAAQ
ncbi:MAG: thioredoxin domain-containing protein [Anaerolineaceae bacterium]|nr:thioredoxin domain-containing protein [Anaerolineaceae bacterium]